jgi:hypothetical protein
MLTFHFLHPPATTDPANRRRRIWHNCGRKRSSADRSSKLLLLVDEVGEEYFQGYKRGRISVEFFQDQANELLVKANRAYQLVQHDPNSTVYRQILLDKGRLHYDLGEHTPALAALRQADELYVAAERRGFVSADEQEIWKQVLRTMGNIYLASRQLEAGKACFLKLLAAPRLDRVDRVSAL